MRAYFIAYASACDDSIAGINDLPLLEKIEKECDEYFSFDPQGGLNHNCSLEECLTVGDIPTSVNKNDFKKNYFFYCIWQDDMLIGFLSYYLAYQQKDTVYLSLLYIKESHRKKGVGTEILEALIMKFSNAQFKIVRIHCSLRNSMGLRFWVNNGFNHIIDVTCNGNLFPENFGGIFDTQNAIAVAFYPDSGKIGIWGKEINKLYKANDNIGYYSGE